MNGLLNAIFDSLTSSLTVPSGKNDTWTFLSYITHDQRRLPARKIGLELEMKKGKMLRQKAKLKLEGDENTKFFHTSIKNRERRNAIK
ncbi:LOW QUALITY PROTEIN: hypothetical protein OSB04_001729 [Centaurea solstitialis]|uniref:Uncharacterized protein n=1 Tax=Centaurea solstitialis TaxID=347529 RepID=A0AA38UAC2_9ASTR|nr:LOW QUALITY PROTEIN: hypothetical protein OSB04_001729 [Centaurea solstitialis]